MACAFDGRNHHQIIILSNDSFATNQIPSDCLGNVVSFLCNAAEFVRFRLVSRQFDDVSVNFLHQKFRTFHIFCNDLSVKIPLVPRMYVPLRTTREINSSFRYLHREHCRLKRSAFCGLCIDSGLPFMSLHLRDIRLTVRVDSVLIRVFDNDGLRTPFIYNDRNDGRRLSPGIVPEFGIRDLRKLLRGQAVDHQILSHHMNRGGPTESREGGWKCICPYFISRYMCAIVTATFCVAIGISFTVLVLVMHL